MTKKLAASLLRLVNVNQSSMVAHRLWENKLTLRRF